MVAGLTVADLMDLADDLEAAFQRLGRGAGRRSPLDRPRNEPPATGRRRGGRCRPCTRAPGGWLELDTAPGEPFRARKAEHEILPDSAAAV